jgi:hypothetical protein
MSRLSEWEDAKPDFREKLIREIELLEASAAHDERQFSAIAGWQEKVDQKTIRVGRLKRVVNALDGNTQIPVHQSDSSFQFTYSDYLSLAYHTPQRPVYET